jgi:hypothetical protein
MEAGLIQPGLCTKMPFRRMNERSEFTDAVFELTDEGEKKS